MKTAKNYATKAVPIGLDNADVNRIHKERQDAKKKAAEKTSGRKEKKTPKKKSEKKVKKNG